MMDFSYLILVKGLFIYKRKGAILLYTSAAVNSQAKSYTEFHNNYFFAPPND